MTGRRVGSRESRRAGELIDHSVDVRRMGNLMDSTQAGEEDETSALTD